VALLRQNSRQASIQVKQQKKKAYNCDHRKILGTFNNLKIAEHQACKSLFPHERSFGESQLVKVLFCQDGTLFVAERKVLGVPQA
jgi:hypothetical protein